MKRRDGWTTRDLAEHFAESQRNIQRDLEALQAAPHYFPLVKDGWRWRLMDGHAYQLPPLTLTLHQAVALYLAARLLARYSDEHNPHVVSALKLLSDILPEEAGRRIRQVAERLTYRRDRPQLTHTLEAISEGWLLHRQVRIQYYGADNGEPEPRETILHPYLLEPSSWGLATYVIAFSTHHKELRTFKIERILKAELLPQHFEPPLDLDVATLLESGWNVMYGKEREEVILRFSPGVTWRVRESVWHPSQKLEELEDGGCRVRFFIAHPREMRPWIRQWGQDVYVEEPLWLRREIAADLRAAAAQYEEE